MNAVKLLAGVAAIALISNTASAEVVYDNTANDLSKRFETGIFEVGDQINLGGSLRVLETLSFEYYYTNSTGSAGAPSVSLSLYANDGATNSQGYATPGSLLYSSGAIGGLITSLTNRASINYNQADDFGDSLLLPETFTWTVKFSGLNANDEIGLDIYSPPTVGSGFGDYWIDSGGGWQLMQASVDPANNPISFGAQVTAVPEPTSLALMLLGGLGCAAWRRRS